METFAALLAICAGNSPVPGEFPTQRPVTQSFDVYFDLRPNKRLSKQYRGWWFETLSPPLWRHRYEWRHIFYCYTIHPEIMNMVPILLCNCSMFRERWRSPISCRIALLMMTSSNGNIFRVTGHLCGEFTGLHKGQWRGALMFALICARINGWVNNIEAGDLRRYRAPLWRHRNEWRHILYCYTIHPEIMNMVPILSCNCSMFRES